MLTTPLFVFRSFPYQALSVEWAADIASAGPRRTLQGERRRDEQIKRSQKNPTVTTDDGETEGRM